MSLTEISLRTSMSALSAFIQRASRSQLPNWAQELADGAADIGGRIDDTAVFMDLEMNMGSSRTACGAY